MTPDPNNLLLGAGEVFFDRFDADGLSTGYRHCGNVESLSTNTSVEKKEKKSSMDGARSTLKEVITGSNMEVSMVFSEFDPENLALALLGEASDFTQDASAVTGGEINGGVALKFDRWYYLGKHDVSNVAIKQGATTLTAGDDYELKADVGLVKILSTGTGLEEITTWDGDAGAVSGKQITGLSVGKVEGALKYIAAADQASGPRYEVDIHKVNLTPDGELPFIGEDFATFNLKGKAQKDITKPAGEQFLVIKEINASFADAS